MFCLHFCQLKYGYLQQETHCENPIALDISNRNILFVIIYVILASQRQDEDR